MPTAAIFTPAILHWLHWTTESRLVRYGIAVLAVIGATCLRLVLNPFLGHTVPYITYFLAITLAGWVGGGGPAAFALIVSSLAAMYFFLPTFSAFATGPDNVVGLIVFMVMGGMIALTCEAMKHSQRRAEQQSRLLEEHRQALQGHLHELERHKHSLDEGERRLGHALDATVEGVWDWNIQTGHVFFSSRWIESLGYSREEVPPHVSFWESIVHPDDMPRLREVLQAHLNGDTQTYAFENRLRMKNGSYRWNLDRGKVVAWDTDGKPLRMVGTDADITEQKHMEQVLRQDIDARKRAEQALREGETHLRETIGALEASRSSLREKLQEMEILHDVVVERELKMMALEKELAALKAPADT